MIKQTMDRQQFADEIRSIRPDNFSYAGLNALFDYLEQLSEDIGEDIEFDAIAICCDYSEMSISEAVAEYSGSIGFAGLSPSHDDEDSIVSFLDMLRDHTTVIAVDDTTIIIQQF